VQLNADGELRTRDQRTADRAKITRFFVQTAAYKKSLGRIFGAATPPGALVLFWALSPTGRSDYP
jgi:hypothetical protein